MKKWVVTCWNPLAKRWIGCCSFADEAEAKREVKLCNLVMRGKGWRYRYVKRASMSLFSPIEEG